MVYFLGRDLTVAITSEHPDYGVIAHTGTGTPTSEVTSLRTASVRDFTQTGSEAGIVDLDGADAVFAGARTGHVDNGLGTVFGSIDQSDSAGLGFTISCEVLNLTGADLSLGAMDEDLSFIGQRATMRVEVKKENSITLTRKKTNDLWDVIYNDARFGLIENFDTGLAAAAADLQIEDGLTAPDFPAYGYRVYLKFRAHTDATSVGLAVAIPNCCITEHAITLGADATTEETITLQSYMDPIIVKEEGTDTMVADATGF